MLISDAATHLVVPDVSDVASLSDDELLARQAQVAGVRRHADAAAATLAAEVARRCARDLGYAGLAQKRGARTAERLVASVTGLSVPEARVMITAGQAVDAGDDWMLPVTTALTTGAVSVGRRRRSAPGSASRANRSAPTSSAPRRSDWSTNPAGCRPSRSHGERGSCGTNSTRRVWWIVRRRCGSAGS